MVPYGVSQQPLGFFFIEDLLMSLILLGYFSFFQHSQLLGMDSDSSDKVLYLWFDARDVFVLWNKVCFLSIWCS
jgi:hypothetical protein